MHGDRVPHGPWNSLLLYLGETIGVQPASTRWLALDFTSFCRFSPYNICFTCRNFICQLTFVNHWSNRKTAPISLYFVLLSILGKRVFVYIRTIFNAANTYVTPHRIVCSTSLTSFVHVGSISMFTNRPCLGLWTVNASRRFHSVVSPNVVSGVLGRKHCCKICVLSMMFCRSDCRLCAWLVIAQSRKLNSMWWFDFTPTGQHGWKMIWKVFFTFDFHILP